MAVKFSEDIVPISDLKVNPGKVVRQVSESHRPVVLTSRGRSVAVLQAVQDYEDVVDQMEFMKGVMKGMAEIEEGKVISLSDVKKRLNIK